MQQGTFRGFEVTLQDPGIATVTFNQPERLNGMTQGFKRDLIEILSQAQMDEAVRVVVITGSGRAFSAGDDITGRPLSGTGAQPLIRQRPRHADRHLRGSESALADAEPGGAQPRQAFDRCRQRRRDPDRPLAGAFVRLPHRLDGSAAGQRHPALRPDAGRGRAVPAAPDDRPAEDSRLPDAQPHRLRRRGARARARDVAARAADGARAGAGARAGGRPAGGDALAQAQRLQRRRADVRPRPRRHRRQDSDLGPPQGRARKASPPSARSGSRSSTSASRTARARGRFRRRRGGPRAAGRAGRDGSGRPAPRRRCTPAARSCWWRCRRDRPASPA